MFEIIKNFLIIKNNWLIIKNNNKKELKNIILSNNKIIVHLNVWKKYYNFLKDKKKIGIWIFNYENLKKIKKKICFLKIIVINFINFSDGRGHSLAYKIRNNFNYLGELRAVGNITYDQIFFMQRVGFNSFLFKFNKNIYNALNSLYDFSIKYQSSYDENKPLFLRIKRKFIKK